MTALEDERGAHWVCVKMRDEALAENDRLRLLAKRFANAIVTGQRHEGLICQAEDFLNEQVGSDKSPS